MIKFNIADDIEDLVVIRKPNNTKYKLQRC